jgi:hypothetical protein
LPTIRELVAASAVIFLMVTSRSHGSADLTSEWPVKVKPSLVTLATVRRQEGSELVVWR